MAEAGSKLVYHYDYGDDRTHDIVVERIEHDPRAGISCTGGARACPPEDCGGSPGYEHLLEVMADPTHEEYGDLEECGRTQTSTGKPSTSQL